MNQAQSNESLREHAKPLPIVAADHRTAALLIAASDTIAALDVKIAELQTQLDELPAQETAVSEDRTKSPADVRAALAVLKDRATDLRLEMKRLEGDKAKAFSEAVALFPKCAPLVAGHFSGLYQAEKSKAVAALAPFFTVGAPITPESIADDLPTVSVARSHAAYALERVKGENPEETFQKYVEVIKEFGLHQPQAA